MKDIKEIRTRKLMVTLNEWFDDVAYYDDDKEDVVIGDTEQGCYDSIMKDDELHLLGEKFVRAMIHTMFTDWETFVFLSFKYKAN